MIAVCDEYDIHPDSVTALESMGLNSLTKVARTRVTGIPVVLIMGHGRFKVVRSDNPEEEGRIFGVADLALIIHWHRSRV